jgi:ketosteroid isomerase-like protein
VTASTSDGTIVDRLYRALADGDVAAARACCTEDLQVWHSFDQKIMNLDESVVGWQQLVDGFAERTFTDVRRYPIPGGWVQRQQMIAATSAGLRMAWPVCLFVTVRDGLICRIDEYIDRAGYYEIAEGATSTAGLESTE